MELTHDDVLEILATVEGSNVEYLELDVGGTRIVIDKSGRGAVAPGAEGGPSVTEPPPPVPTAPAAAPAVAPVPTPSDPSAAAAPATEHEGLVSIDAPMVGVFYRSPEPGAAPYIEVGDRIDADATVGLVEVMKMFNSITAGTTGVVVEILAENEQFVEYGEPLIMVRPEPIA